MSGPARVLVAGVGNVFFGDDGFGPEVARALLREPPAETKIEDFGIRGLHLAYELLTGYERAILIDAAARGDVPGTLYVIEPEVSGDADPGLSPHALTPDHVLRRLAPGTRPRAVRVVGCEPQTLGDDDAPAELSAPVRAAVDEAVRLVEALVAALLAEGTPDA